MKKFGIDLDGICFGFGDGFRAWLGDKCNIFIEDEEITSYYWYEGTNKIDKETFFKEFDKFGRAQGYRNLKLLPGTREALWAIKNAGHELYYVTNRPGYAVTCTVEALRVNGFPDRENLEFAFGAKAPIINDLGLDIFIDDSPRTIAEIAANTQARIYCWDYEYNRHLHNLSGYTRVSSWEEFLEHEGVIFNGCVSS